MISGSGASGEFTCDCNIAHIHIGRSIVIGIAYEESTTEACGDGHLPQQIPVDILAGVIPIRCGICPHFQGIGQGMNFPIDKNQGVGNEGIRSQIDPTGIIEGDPVEVGFQTHNILDAVAVKSDSAGAGIESACLAVKIPAQGMQKRSGSKCAGTGHCKVASDIQARGCRCAGRSTEGKISINA